MRGFPVRPLMRAGLRGSRPGRRRGSGPAGPRLLILLVLVLLAGLIWLARAHALEPGEALPDAAQEARARTLSQELRCMVCQNQSIDDSNAPLARDLRKLVRDRIASGDSDRQVLDYLVARYGDFVLLKPPFAAYTWLLWIAPFAALAAGIAAVLLGRRRRGARRDAQELSAEESARLEAELARLDG